MSMMDQASEAVKKLTDFLTFSGEPSVDQNTDFPTSASARGQLYFRTLSDEFGMKSFGRQADRYARIMASRGRQSRGEAVTALAGHKIEGDNLIDNSPGEENEE